MLCEEMWGMHVCVGGGVGEGHKFVLLDHNRAFRNLAIWGRQNKEVGSLKIM